MLYADCMKLFMAYMVAAPALTSQRTTVLPETSSRRSRPKSAAATLVRQRDMPDSAVQRCAE